MILNKINPATLLKITWGSQSEKFIALSITQNTDGAVINLTKNFQLAVIKENYSGHKQQPENFTLLDENRQILSIDAKVEFEKVNFTTVRNDWKQ